jgi:hypothetical protein
MPKGNQKGMYVPMSLPIKLRTNFTALCGLGFAATMLLAAPARADQWDKKTVLTTNQEIQVSDTVLGPGQYVFKLLESPADRHIVEIYNADETHIIDIVHAIPNYRLEPTGHTRFRFWETPPGQARALRAWFYPGDNFGQEFPYPKHPVTLAMATPPAAPPVSVPESSVAPAPAPEPAPAPAPEEPQANAQQPLPAPEAAPAPVPAPEPVETAQNNPPPPLPAPAAQTPPERLPQTASFYPLAGLIGLISFGLYVLLKLKPVRS